MSLPRRDICFGSGGRRCTRGSGGLGLFAAVDGDELETVLASMPLRRWRTDLITPLLPHPNDPARVKHLTPLSLDGPRLVSENRPPEALSS